jgi:hypothetical protein
MNAKDQPVEYSAQERAPHLSPAYCYVIQHPTGASWFITSRDRPVVIADLPDYMAAEDPQTFTPAQVKHSGITANDRFEAQSTTISVTTENPVFGRYFLTAGTVKLRAWILKGQSEDLAAGALTYGENVITVQSGILGKVGIEGNLTEVELTPEPFYMEGKVPRIYFARQCQHMLYGPLYRGVGCGLNKELFSFETIIAAIDPAQKIVTLTGQKPGAAATYFNTGHFQNITAGGLSAIAYSAFNGGNTDLKLAAWNPDLAVADEIVAYAGCAHTVAACRAFGNQARFGGFPDIPERTPLNGVA